MQFSLYQNLKADYVIQSRLQQVQERNQMSKYKHKQCVSSERIDWTDIILQWYQGFKLRWESHVSQALVKNFNQDQNEKKQFKSLIFRGRGGRGAPQLSPSAVTKFWLKILRGTVRGGVNSQRIVSLIYLTSSPSENRRVFSSFCHKSLTAVL